MKINFTRPFLRCITTNHRVIYEFPVGSNVDQVTIDSFAEEWKSFHGFEPQEIKELGNEYFDIITKEMLHPESSVLEIGCGSGRFLKYVRDRAGYIVGIEPGDAIYAADKLIGDDEKIQLVKASANDLPFDDETFDFVYSIGVLHHIPDTKRAMQACVDKVKRGGYFFTYLYYSLDNRGFFFRLLFQLSSLLRKGIAKLPAKPKRIVCDVLAVILYMPFVLFSRLLKYLGVKPSIRRNIPLNGYENKSFYIIRNDSLDRFGTPLEQRFSREEIKKMMQDCGLESVTFSSNIPYWHAVGKKK